MHFILVFLAYSSILTVKLRNAAKTTVSGSMSMPSTSACENAMRIWISSVCSMASQPCSCVLLSLLIPKYTFFGWMGLSASPYSKASKCRWWLHIQIGGRVRSFSCERGSNVPSRLPKFAFLCSLGQPQVVLYPPYPPYPAQWQFTFPYFLTPIFHASGGLLMDAQSKLSWVAWLTGDCRGRSYGYLREPPTRVGWNLWKQGDTLENIWSRSHLVGIATSSEHTSPNGAPKEVYGFHQPLSV